MPPPRERIHDIALLAEHFAGDRGGAERLEAARVRARRAAGARSLRVGRQRPRAAQHRRATAAPDRTTRSTPRRCGRCFRAAGRTRQEKPDRARSRIASPCSSATSCCRSWRRTAIASPKPRGRAASSAVICTRSASNWGSISRPSERSRKSRTR